jgi:hypothetical protein
LQLGLSSHENATPISILHNSSAHLIGPGRCIGGVAIGYLGVRIFHPQPVAKTVLSVGGIPILIGLVAMATTSEALYAALKALVCVVKSNSVNGASSATLVDRASWQMLGFLLKRKRNLLSMRVLHLVFGLVSTDISSSIMKDQRGGFSDLLGDLEIWCGGNNYYNATIGQKGSSSGDNGSEASTPSEHTAGGIIGKKQGASEPQTQVQHFDFNHADLEKALYEHFLQMLTEDAKNSLEVLREAGIVPKLLRRLSQASPNQGSILLLLGHLLAHKTSVSSADLITFGHFVVGTLPADSVTREGSLTETIELRNKCLQLIHSLMYTGKVLNVGFCEELVSRLGFDFILLFLAPHLHPSTLLWALRVLLLLLTSSPTLKNKFRDGATSTFGFGRTITYHYNLCGGRNGGGILPLKKQDSKLGISDDDSPMGGSSPVSSGAGVTVASIASGLAGKGGAGGRNLAGGWARLSWLLGQRCEDVRAEGTDILPTEVWLILCAMVLSQPCRNVSMKIGEGDQMTLDGIWNYVFAVPSNKMASSLYGKVTLCPDAMITLLTLIRCYITAETPNYAGNVSSPCPPLSARKLMSPSSSTGSFFNYQSDVGSCLIQFLCYLYSHTPEFQSTFTSAEILSALAASVMPIEVKAAIEASNIATDYVDYEEIKAFSDSEPLVLLGQKIEKLNSAAIELGEDPASALSDAEGSSQSNERTGGGSRHSSSEESHPKESSSKLGEVVHDFPHESAGLNIEALMNHPAKKIILDVLRMIIIDWMSASGSQAQGKSGMNMNVLIDTVLDAGNPEISDLAGGTTPSPSGGNSACSYVQCSTAIITQFHTNLLGTLLDHLIAFDLDRMTSYLHSVALFLSRLVDKLWLETFSRDPQVVLDYLLVLVNHCRNKRVPPATTDMIYNSFNRVVLFILSRRSNQWDKVETLKKLRNIRTVVFGAGNHQQEFFGCLVHVLMQLVDGLPIALESGNKTQWHVRVTPRPGEEGLPEGADFDSRREHREAARLDSEIFSTAEKVWEDLYISKKPIVEDLFKISFPSPQPPALSSLRDQIGDSANKLWLVYVATETSPGAKKNSNVASMSQSWEIHQQLQSKLQKVTGGLTRLAGRSGIRKDSEKEKTIRELISQWPDAKKCQNVKTYILLLYS